jgi:hypothetical protein
MTYDRAKHLQESRKRFIEDLSNALQVCHENDFYPEVFKRYYEHPDYEWLTTMQDDLAELTDSQLEEIADNCVERLDEFTMRMPDDDAKWLYKNGGGTISPASVLDWLRHTQCNYYFFLNRQNND